MFRSVSRLGASVWSDLCVPRMSPSLVSVSHLRTGANTDHTRAESLPQGQSIVETEAEAKSEIFSKINSQLSTEPGRLFAVVYVRGHQHKVTQGGSTLISHL